MAISNNDLAKIKTKFLDDPDWQIIEAMWEEQLAPLLDMTSIDTSQPAENVKAEVIARSKAYNVIVDILDENKVTNRKFEKLENPYR